MGIKTMVLKAADARAANIKTKEIKTAEEKAAEVEAVALKTADKKNEPKEMPVPLTGGQEAFQRENKTFQNTSDEVPHELQGPDLKEWQKGNFSLRLLTRSEELEALLPLQVMTWGTSEVVPVSQLLSVVHNGGLILGLCAETSLVGFSYGFPGFDGIPYFWSQRLAVAPDWQNKGLGEWVKEVQAACAYRMGYRRMLWSYDPLRTRNAHLNLNKLGARGIRYVEDFYGHREDEANRGLPSDRLIVEWKLLPKKTGEKGERVEAVKITKENVSVKELPLAFPLKEKEGLPVPDASTFYPTGSRTGLPVLVPVPDDIDRIRERSPELALAWRFALRSALAFRLSDGGEVRALVFQDSEPVCYYLVV